MNVNKLILFVLVLPMILVSCSEDDDTVYEYENWVERNDTYFDNLTDSVNKLIAAGRTDWKRYRAWSKLPSTTGKNADYILVNVIESGDQTTATALYTDSVDVHYIGRLIPSTSYPQGYVFNDSYTIDYDTEVSPAVGFWVNKVVDGWITALLQMRVGDRWKVYVPYALGYGTSDYTSGGNTIPGGSTLIFDMKLAAITHPTIE